MHHSTRTMPRRVLPGDGIWALHDAEASRAIEAEAVAVHAPHELMQRAGLSVARLALALAPAARNIWVACGPGNNGGDGWVAARHLHLAGLDVTVSLIGEVQQLPSDARRAHDEALQAGLAVSDGIPEGHFDLVIDGLLGLGATRPPHGAMAQTIDRLNQAAATILAIDLPSGLNASTGQRLGAQAVRATHTLSLLTCKPGLFTADGRDHCGSIWIDSLGVVASQRPPTARLAGAADLRKLLARRAHASHKGTYGDLAVVGGSPSMTGAAFLAARAALAAGAGRVFVSLLDPSAPAFDAAQPELMLRHEWWRSDPAVLAASTIVCGCGGGPAVRDVLPTLLARCPRLVLDADALNALSTDVSLRQQVLARAGRGQATVLTPHPLEAARLAQVDVHSIQVDRLRAAQQLSTRFDCVVLLKGSGSIVAAPQRLPVIVPTGNALLASAGTGDVLAGWIGGLWAQCHAGAAPAVSAQRAALAGGWLHGRAADRVTARLPNALALRASELIEGMRDAAAAMGEHTV